MVKRILWVSVLMCTGTDACREDSELELLVVENFTRWFNKNIDYL